MRPRSLASLAAGPLGAALLLVAPSSRAEGPDPGAAIVVGAAVFVASFTVGGLLLAEANGGYPQSNAGWLTIMSGFALAPLASHAVVGEWGRGLVLMAPPAAMIGGTGALFEHDSGTILSGSLSEQRVMWALFTGGLVSGMFGVVDAALANRRATPPVTIAPTVGAGRMGLTIGGTL